MRCIVTTTEDGRSRVLSTEPVAPDAVWQDLWTFSADAPLGAAPAAREMGLSKAARGAGSWSIIMVPSADQMRAALAQGVPGLDANGFHLTGTIDFVIVLDGAVTLALDDEEIVVEAGDLVVQRDTNHAWWNHNDYPIRLLALMLGTAA